MVAAVCQAGPAGAGSPVRIPCLVACPPWLLGAPAPSSRHSCHRLCRYYNWRKDTLSDLQLFLLFNLALFLVSAGIEGAILRGMGGMDSAAGAAGEAFGAEAQAGDAWLNLYIVFKTVFWQDMPSVDSGVVNQASRRRGLLCAAAAGMIVCGRLAARGRTAGVQPPILVPPCWPHCLV